MKANPSAGLAAASVIRKSKLAVMTGNSPGAVWSKAMLLSWPLMVSFISRRNFPVDPALAAVIAGPGAVPCCEATKVFVIVSKSALNRAATPGSLPCETIA